MSVRSIDAGNFIKIESGTVVAADSFGAYKYSRLNSLITANVTAYASDTV